MNSLIQIKKNKILIRHLRAEDANDNYLNMINNANKYILSKDKIKNLFHLRKYIFLNNYSINQLLLGIFIENKHIGNIKFDILKDGKAILGIFIGNKNYQGKNLFRLVLKILEPKLKNIFKIYILYLGVNKNNHPAIKAFKKSGFKIYNWKRKKIFNQIIMKKNLFR